MPGIIRHFGPAGQPPAGSHFSAETPLRPPSGALALAVAMASWCRLAGDRRKAATHGLLAMAAERGNRFPAERIAVSTLAERPELRAQLFSAEFAAALPEFMRHDPHAALYFGTKALDRYLDFALAAVDRDAPERVIARGFSVPFAFRDGTPGRNELPLGGWDAVIRWADEDWRAGRRPTAVSALEIVVLPPYRARGVSRLMLEAMIANMWTRGFGDLYAPLRPSDKHMEPLVPFADYVARTRGDGLMIPGCARMSAPAAGSSQSRRTAW